MITEARLRELDAKRKAYGLCNAEQTELIAAVRELQQRGGYDIWCPICQEKRKGHAREDDTIVCAACGAGFDIPPGLVDPTNTQQSKGEVLVSRDDRYQEIMKPLFDYKEEVTQRLNNTYLQTPEFDAVDAELKIIRECVNRIARAEILRDRALPAKGQKANE